MSGSSLRRLEGDAEQCGDEDLGEGVPGVKLEVGHVTRRDLVELVEPLADAGRAPPRSQSVVRKGVDDSATGWFRGDDDAVVGVERPWHLRELDEPLQS